MLFRKLFVFYNYFCFILVFILFFPLIYFFSRKPSRYIVLNHIRKIWAFLGCALSGIFMEIEYENTINKSFIKKNHTPFIFCSNHSSYLDTLVMSQVAHGAFFYMGKHTLLKNPVLRIFFKTIDISFDRDSKLDSYRAFKSAGENLESGRSLVIFPEGSISSHPPNLKAFKPGAFRLAIEKEVPIVPVTILNSWEIFYAEGQQGAKPGFIKCIVHAPVFTKGMSPDQDAELKEKVFSIIQNQMNDYVWNQNSKNENPWATEHSSLIN